MRKGPKPHVLIRFTSLCYAIRKLMIWTASVELKLFNQRAGQVHIVATGQVKDTNHCIGKFDLAHGAMG